MTESVDPAVPAGIPEDSTAKSIAKREIAAWLVLALLIFAGLGTYVGIFAICREEATAAGSVVVVCGPVGAADLPLVGLILLAVLLLTPRLSEFGIPGLVTLKRDLTQQIARVDDKVEHLLSVQQQQNLSVYVVDPARAAAEFPDKQREFEESERRVGDLRDAEREAEAAGEDAITREHREISDERAVLEARLMRAWGRLEPWVYFASTGQNRWETPRRGIIVDENVLLAMEGPLRRWRRTFDDEITVVRATRNSVAHQPWLVSDDQVQAAVLLAERLYGVLESDVLRPHQGE